MGPLPAALLVVVFAALPLAARGPMADEQGAGRPLAIIVHRSNPAENVSFAELRRIFMLETQTWPHGRKITVVLREKGQPERAEAIRIICGLSESEYDKHVLFQTFRGAVNIGPRSIQSASLMLRFVYNAPGAIGYVFSDQVDNTVKLLRIDGALPGDPGYPLRPVVPREAEDVR